MSVAAEGVNDSSHAGSAHDVDQADDVDSLAAGLSRRVLGARTGRTSNDETVAASDRLLAARRAHWLAATEAAVAALDQLRAGCAAADVLVGMHTRTAAALVAAGYPTACTEPRSPR